MSFIEIAGSALVAAGAQEGEFLPEAAPIPYPTEHLGPILGPAAEAIAAKIQVPPEVAAQSVLSTAALVAQGFADVLMPFGQSRPLSLYFLTIASSGDRKSSADNEALKAIKEYENEAVESYDAKRAIWTNANETWSIEKQKIKSDKSLDPEERLNAFNILGSKPLPPFQPVLTSGDITLEGLIENWFEILPAMGLFSAEGAQFTAGRGMSGEARLRTAGGLSEFWDGKTFTKIRVRSGVKIVRGRRLSMHLMVQPDVATAFLADPLLLDQGLFSRLLIACPTSIIGTRTFRYATSEEEGRISAYHDRVAHLIRQSPAHHANPRSGLIPRALGMSKNATELWIQFHNWVELSSGHNGPLHIIKDISAKLAEQTARIAGVMAIIANEDVQYIDEDQMASAIWLMDWYFKEALRLRNSNRVSPEVLRAQGLFEWLRTQEDRDIKFTAILQYGPIQTRRKQEAEAALRLLVEHQLVIESQDRPRTFRITERGDA